MNTLKTLVLVLTVAVVLCTQATAAPPQQPGRERRCPPRQPGQETAKARQYRLRVISASWCVPCQQLKALLRAESCGVDGSIAEDLSDGELDALQIHNYPTILLYRDGTEVARREGWRSLEDLRKWIAVHKDDDAGLASSFRAAGQVCSCDPADPDTACTCTPGQCRCADGGSCQASVQVRRIPTVQQGYAPTFGTPVFPSYGPPVSYGGGGYFCPPGRT